MGIYWKENMFMDMFDPRGMQLLSNLSPGENISLLCYNCIRYYLHSCRVYTQLNYTVESIATYYRANCQSCAIVTTSYAYIATFKRTNISGANKLGACSAFKGE